MLAQNIPTTFNHHATGLQMAILNASTIDLLQPAISHCPGPSTSGAQSNTAGQRSPEIRERDPFDPKEWIRHHAGHAEVFEGV